MKPSEALHRQHGYLPRAPPAASEVTEFNIHADPEAASEVFARRVSAMAGDGGGPPTWRCSARGDSDSFQLDDWSGNRQAYRPWK